MGYVDEHLLPGERVVHRTKLHPIVFLPAGLLLLLAVIWLAMKETRTAGTLTLFLCALVFVPAAIRYVTSEFAVTTTRVIIKSGWLNRKTIELQLAKVEGLSIDQLILGRVLDYGTLSVGGTGGTKERFKQILAPIAFRVQVQQQIEAVVGTQGEVSTTPGANAISPSARDERECPHCAERILAKAARCRFCGQPVTPVAPAQ